MQAFMGKRKQLYRDFWALQDISFDLPRAITMGILGRNGSGKSTLLKMICGTLEPTTGTLEVGGRVGALLELGSGFDPEFTGRENIFMNASLLGLTRQETLEKLDSIIAFADIGDFIDQPLKLYSSGMAVRLAFSVQAHTDPELLIIDEALSVGDELFQRKCLLRLDLLKEQGTSILYVSHNTRQLGEHCDQVMLLHKGRMQLFGETKKIITTYQRLCNSPADQWDDLLTGIKGKADQPSLKTSANLEPPSKISYEAKGATIEAAAIIDADGNINNAIDFGTPFQVRLECTFQSSIEDIMFHCAIVDSSGRCITGQSTTQSESLKIDKAGNELRARILFYFKPGLVAGTYFINAGIKQGRDRLFLHRVIDISFFKIRQSSQSPKFGACDLKACEASIQVI